MPIPNRADTRWARSFPTEYPTQIFSYSCTFSVRGVICNKPFSRQCDLRRHEKNHTRPSRCEQCHRGFSSSKDLERHLNTRHKLTVKYFCPYDRCRESMSTLNDGERLGEEDWGRGFKRKDHWQKHLQDEHNLSRETVGELQRNHVAMPPTAILKDEKWIAVLPACISRTYKTPKAATAAKEVVSKGEAPTGVPLQSPSDSSQLEDLLGYGETIVVQLEESVNGKAVSQSSLN